MIPNTPQNKNIAEDTWKRLSALSIVIPAAPGETAWRGLLADLRPLPPQGEILLCGADPEPEDLGELAEKAKLRSQPKWLQHQGSRAARLNHGGHSAAGDWLWFIHADSRLSEAWHWAVAGAMRTGGNLLAYGRLRYADDGPGWARLNAAGANIRSRILGLPFGDQSFLMTRAEWEALESFDEDFGRGEDLDLVVRAKARGLPLRCLDLTVTTSARRFAEQGWWATTRSNFSETRRLLAASRQRLKRQEA